MAEGALEEHRQPAGGGNGGDDELDGLRSRRGGRRSRAQPDRAGHEHHGDRPGGVQERPDLVRPGRRLEQVHGVAHRQQRATQSENQELGVAPRRKDGQGADDEGNEHEIANRIGQVGCHLGRGTADRPHDCLEHEGGGQAGRPEARNDAVEPRRQWHLPHFHPQQEDHADIGQGVEREVEGVVP